MKYHVTMNMLDELSNGNIVTLRGGVRPIELDPKSDAHRKLEALDAKYEVDRSKLVGEIETPTVTAEIVEPTVDTNIDD